MKEVASRHYSTTPPLPTEAQVEVTSACNLRCAVCLVRCRPPVNKLEGAMTPELFDRLVEQVPSVRRLTLQGWGEPLLSPYLIRHLRAAKAAGMSVGSNSNATLLTRKRAHELIAASLDWLHVSVDVARAETFEGIREGAADHQQVGTRSTRSGREERRSMCSESMNPAC